MRDTFFQYVHMPLLMIFFTVFWIMIGFRIWTFRRRQDCGWRTFSGLSVVLSVAAGVFLTVYIALNAGIYGTDQELYSFFDTRMNIAGEDETTREPENLSDADCGWIIGLVKSMMQVSFPLLHRGSSNK